MTAEQNIATARKLQTAMILSIDHYADGKMVECWELVGPWQDEG